MTALPRQDQLFDVPADATSDDATARPTALDGTTTARPAEKKPLPRVKSTQELEREGVKRIYLELIGRPYAAQHADHAAWADLKKIATVAEIEEFWRFSLSRPAKDWSHAPTIWQLKRKWNDIAALLRPSSRAEVDVYSCDVCGASVDALTQGRRWVDKQWLCSSCFRKQTPYEWKGAAQ